MILFNLILDYYYFTKTFMLTNNVEVTLNFEIIIDNNKINVFKINVFQIDEHYNTIMNKMLRCINDTNILPLEDSLSLRQQFRLSDSSIKSTEIITRLFFAKIDLTADIDTALDMFVRISDFIIYHIIRGDLDIVSGLECMKRLVETYIDMVIDKCNPDFDVAYFYERLFQDIIMYDYTEVKKQAYKERAINGATNQLLILLPDYNYVDYRQYRGVSSYITLINTIDNLNSNMMYSVYDPVQALRRVIGSKHIYYNYFKSSPEEYLYKGAKCTKSEAINYLINGILKNIINHKSMLNETINYKSFYTNIKFINK